MRNISQKVGKGEFDLTKYTSPCTLDIVCGKFRYLLIFVYFYFVLNLTKTFFFVTETVMGSPMEIQDGKNTDYMQALAK